LVLYGDPPAFKLRDSAGRVVSNAFVLSQSNQRSFEVALMKALAAYFGPHVQLSTARLVRIHDATSFTQEVKKFNPSHLVYYGHALDGTNALLPALGKSITAWQITNTIKGTAIRHLDLLGCSTVSLAADLATALPKVSFGHLRVTRFDNIEVDLHSRQVKNVVIDRSHLYHFGGR
jgi:hypothetical protein